MNLGDNLFQARKKAGLFQETVAEKLGVSRQTISKWETEETIPDIYQSKKLAKLYNLSLDELIEFDADLLDKLSHDYGYSELDSMLVLKDILYHEWKDKK